MSFPHVFAQDDFDSSFDEQDDDDGLHAALGGLGEGHYPGQYVYDDEFYDDMLYTDERVLSRTYPGYTRADLNEQVTFSRPDGSDEGKDVAWCLCNDFREIKDGVWSGGWHPDYPGSNEERDTELNRRSRALITSLQTGVVDRNVDPPTFEAALALKQKGNTLFIAKKYSAALMSYSRAREKLTSVGMLLSGDQRAAFVNILSNEAECYLRLKRYTEAQMSATEAITLDVKHVKSLLRRAKATFYGATSDGHGINPFAIAQAQQDLDKILRMDGDGVEEAAKLLEEMHVQARNDMGRIRGRGGLVDDY